MLTPKDIEQKVFSVARLGAGYAKHEVDAFLDECRDELDRAQQAAAVAQNEVRRLLDEKNSQTIQLSAIPAGPLATTGPGIPPLAPLAPVESSITKILQRGQQLADEALNEAKVEAERLKAEAQVEVEKLKAAAATEAEQLKADAAAQLEKLKADSAALASTNATAAKILQNALAALTPPTP